LIVPTRKRVHAELAGERAVVETELHHALSPGLPTQITVSPDVGCVVSPGCRLRPPRRVEGSARRS
jgi:hypothetical protein